ncbi:hypothetical protein [Microbacterium soli]|uniref:Uncharacterized protein n=1 Tax=Microbacterium soli TaxID=446075 RepID=A0ABP7MML0_9MICO
MAHGLLPRIGTGRTSRLPGRGKAFVKASMVDESGFSYEYQELEVDMATARETVASLFLHADLTASRAATIDTDAGADSCARTGKKPRRRSA